MIESENITLRNTPRIWFKDKIGTFWSSKITYISTVILWVVAIVGLLADLKDLFSEKNIVIIILCSFLFVYGLINVLYSTAHQKIIIQLNREIKSFYTMHEIDYEKTIRYDRIRFPDSVYFW